MKLYPIILAGAALLAAASCTNLNKTPVFDPADSFAAFDKTVVSATEEAGVVSIPVTIASVDPVNTTVTYSIDTENSTAVAGVNFNLVDPSAVLTFSGNARTANIEIEVIPIRGDAGYTGDKVVSIKLESSSAVNIGANKVCTFTINDLDHPLAAILGEYTVAGNTVTLEKDPDDVSVVHFPDLMASTLSWLGSSGSLDIIGQVSADMSSIVIPLPVDSGYTYSNGENLKVYACDEENVYYDVSSITLTRTDTGYVCEEYALISFIKGAGYLEYYDPPFTFVKK